MQNVKIVDLMTRDPIKVSPETSLLQCARIMLKKRVGSLLLVSKNRLVGIITERDILWSLMKKTKKEELSNVKAIDLSPRKIAAIRPSASIRESIDKMKKTKLEKLPVIKNGELLGVITVRDILKFHPEAYPEIEEFAAIREQTNKLKRFKKARQSSDTRGARKERPTGDDFEEMEPETEGVCEECGNRESLYRINGSLICEGCMASR